MRFVTLVAAAMLAISSAAAPRRTFAIVVDPKSQAQAQAELDLYAQSIRQCNGWDVVFVTDRWGVPDSIRAALKQLHSNTKAPLVGAVFVGDIPIPMIRDAQYMTSAFKMDQKAYPRKDSSVPSDRFYDDFSLDFDYLGCDDDGDPYFYYSLTAKSAQRLHPDLFTGRIRPTDAGGTSRYDKLRRYLLKAVAEKQSQNRLDHIFYFTGSGSLSESAVAHQDERVTYYDHIPALRRAPEALNFMDYGDRTYIKTHMMNQLMQPEMDLAILHHHGNWDTQYLSKPPKWMHKDSVDKAMLDLTLPDFQAFGFQPDCRVVIFDACYNASFHRQDCIANEYIFGAGRTVACLGGTVNVLQDKWYDHYLGLMAEGMCVGRMNMLTPYLECHVVGDPTFTFAPWGESGNIDRLLDNPKTAWKPLLSHSLGDVRCLAMEQLFGQGRIDAATMQHMLENDEAAPVRLQAMLLLQRMGGDAAVKALKTALRDNREMVQRFAINSTRFNGSPELIPDLVRLLLSNNPSARVAFNTTMALQFFDRDLLLDEFRRQVAAGAVRRIPGEMDKELRRLERSITSNSTKWTGDVQRLCDGTMSEKEQMRNADYLRLYLPHTCMKQVMQFVKTCPNAALQKGLLHAIGWHTNTYLRPWLTEQITPMASDSSLAPEVRDEALRTVRRLNQ